MPPPLSVKPPGGGPVYIFKQSSPSLDSREAEALEVCFLMILPGFSKLIVSLKIIENSWCHLPCFVGANPEQDRDQPLVDRLEGGSLHSIPLVNVVDS